MGSARYGQWVVLGFVLSCGGGVGVPAPTDVEPATQAAQPQNLPDFPAPIGLGPPGDLLRLVQLGMVRAAVPTNFAATVNSAGLFSAPSISLSSSPLGLSADIFSSVASNSIVPGTQLPGPSVEGHLFVADLVGINDYLRSLYAGVDQACINGTGSCWRNGTNGSELPRGIVLPYPPNPSWQTNGNQRYRLRPLDPAYFWSDPQFPPPSANEYAAAPSTSDPSGTGSIKSVRIHIPGLCSFEKRFTEPDGSGIYDKISDGLWQRFQDRVRKLDLTFDWSFSRDYSYLTTLLDDGVALVGTKVTPRGGFFLYHWFEGTGHSPFPGDTDIVVDFSANYEYALDLDQGILAVHPTKNWLEVRPQTSYGDFADALNKDLPNEFVQDALDTQTFAIPSTVCTTPVGATVVASAVASFAEQEAAALNFSDDEKKRIVKAIEAPNPSGGFINWTCKDGQVGVILRGTRINVYGDAVELVWFDDKEVDNANYGVYLALLFFNEHPGTPIGSGTAPTGLDKVMCARPRAQVGGTHFVAGHPVKDPLFEARPIVTVSRLGN